MLRDQFKGIAKVIKAQFEEITAQISHAGGRGVSREEQVREFLRTKLPQRFSVGSGEVMATTGDRSRQQDVVIYDSFYCPLLYSSVTSQIFPSESVYAVLEVKSNLDKTELEDCVKKVESVKKLPSEPGRIPISPGVLGGGQKTVTVGGVFAFSSTTSLSTLRRNLNDLNSNVELGNRINIVCVLDKGLLVNISPDKKILIHSTNTSQLASVYTGEDSLLMFYLLLMDYLNTSSVVPPNLMLYADAYALSFRYETSVHEGVSEILHSAFEDESRTISEGQATIEELLKALKLREESKE